MWILKIAEWCCAGNRATRIAKRMLLRQQPYMEALGAFDLNEIGILFTENIENLICLVEFDCGEDAKIALLGVPEGDDEPEKYPYFFNSASVMILSKIDLLSYLDFDAEAAYGMFMPQHRFAYF